MNEEKFITKFYSCDNEEQFLSDVYHNIRSLENENKKMKQQLDKYKNRYKNRLNNQLSEDVEPDFEDYYLAEIEGKANECDELKTKYNNLLKENFKLKQHPQNNWNELKNWLGECLKEQNKNRLYDNNSYQAGIIDTFENTIDKMQELEGNNEDNKSTY